MEAPPDGSDSVAECRRQTRCLDPLVELRNRLRRSREQPGGLLVFAGLDVAPDGRNLPVEFLKKGLDVAPAVGRRLDVRSGVGGVAACHLEPVGSAVPARDGECRPEQAAVDCDRPGVGMGKLECARVVATSRHEQDPVVGDESE